MKTNKVEKVITTPKDWIGRPLKRHLTETLTWVNNLKTEVLEYWVSWLALMHVGQNIIYQVKDHLGVTNMHPAE